MKNVGFLALFSLEHVEEVLFLQYGVSYHGY